MKTYNGQILIKPETKKVDYTQFIKYSKPLSNQTVFLSINGTIGNTAFYNNENIILGKSACYINLMPQIDKKFIRYKLKSQHFLKYALQNATGSTIKNVGLKTIREYKLWISSIPEQRAIVKKIETLFSSLDAGIADLKKSQEQLKIYRQAILKKAFEGELINTKFNNLVPIGEIVSLNPKIDKTKVFDELECQFVPMKLVEEKVNKINLTDTKKYKDLQNKSYTYFSNNDIIFAKVTPCMENGKIAVAKDLLNEVAFGSSEFHVLRSSSKILSEFLFYFIVQDKFRNEAEQNMTGAVGLRRVPKKFIEDYIIPLPTIEQQQQTVKEIESRLSVCNAVEKQIKNSLGQAENLRQSILKKAFEGSLLNEKELKACKAQPDYEPASVLLERIKAKKEAHKPVKKISKKKVS